MEKLNFYERAEKLGHSSESLKSGKSVKSTLTVPNITSLRELLSHGETSKERESNFDCLFGSITSLANNDSHEAFMMRVNGFLYGNTELSDDDHSRLSQAFPMDVYTASSETHDYAAGKNDLGTSQNLLLLNYSKVTIADKGYITIQNTPLRFTCDSLTRTGSAPTGYGDFNILGVTGGTPGQTDTGTTGGDGSDGNPGNCSSAGIAGASGQIGHVGKTGGTGGIGKQGGDGLPSLQAEIRISTSLDAASLTVWTRSGTGGIGGVGGTGGIGGNGGGGGNGASCGCTGSGAGNGESGGKGGQGGIGGLSGNGVNAAGNIKVLVPTAYMSIVFPNKLPTHPGIGGVGGVGGAGGAGGSKGSGGKHNGDGSDGSVGGKGSTGGNGAKGTQSGTPADISIQPY
jgi:hypothetical protein